MFDRDLMARCWADFPHIRCPLCNGPLKNVLAACPVCGRWWEHYGMTVPSGPYIEAARILPTLVPLDAKSILGVGAGDGFVAQPDWESRRMRIVGIDIMPSPGHEWVEKIDARDALSVFGPSSFDVVMACDMIEHVDKETGKRLLKDFSVIARKMVLVTTPNGFTEQDPALCPNEPWAWNPHQKHVCGWSVEEFRDAGYEVYANAINEAGGIESCYLLAVWRSK